MNSNIYVRHILLALSGIVVGLMSVSLIFDLAVYTAPASEETERLATLYYLHVRSSFVPYIVVATLVSLVLSVVYRLVYFRNWRTYLIALGVLALSMYYVTVVFALEDNLPYLTDFSERVDSLLQIGFAHLMTWVAGWATMILLIPEAVSESP